MMAYGRILVAVLAVFTLLPVSLQAGLLATTPLALEDGADPTGAAWSGLVQGSVAFNVDPIMPPIFNDEVEGALDFAVFEAAKFEQFCSDNGLPAPDPPVSDLVYAYQVAIDAAYPGVGKFTVGIDSTDPRTFPDFIIAGDEAPGEWDDQGTSMLWGFFENLGASETSAIMYFTSPNLPEPDTASMQSGVAGPTLMGIPSPGDNMFEVPEPTSIGLTILGIIATLPFTFCLRRRRAPKV